MRLFTPRRWYLALVTIALYFGWDYAFGSTGGVTTGPAGGHDEGPVIFTLLELVIILLAAKLGGDLFERFNSPAVLGELVIGMLLGNLHLIGIDFLEPFKTHEILEILAELGVIILLFEVGLESSVFEMLRVGVSSFLVAIAGVIAPFFLGWGTAVLFLPESSIYVHIFIGATLTATSVGITARVLKDIGKIHSREAKIILGAAVIDDILGLVILAIVSGVISAVAAGGVDNGVSSGHILWIIGKAVLFVLGAIAFGHWVLPSIFHFGFTLRVSGVMLTLSLLVCFGLAWAAGKVGLAPIVGAFAAGLILDEVHFKKFRERGERHVEDLISPIAVFLVPIFFVRMGMLVDLSTFAQVEILGFAAVLTLVAILGKQVCSLVIFDKGVKRIAIGLGMIPRGEVGLIFAGIGASLMLYGEPVISKSTYSAVVIMVIVTTLVTPPALVWTMLRGEKKD